MIPDYLAQPYITLFRGRGDVYGHNEGRCVKEQLTNDVFQKHFSGEAPIGIYPMVPHFEQFYVAWGCVDFDTADADQNAVKLHDALMEAGIVSWIEKSRSKGFHVWVFAEQAVLAEDMRNMLVVASHVAETPTTEVNPKQTTLKAGQYGNYVRLPYPNLDDQQTDKQRIFHKKDVESGSFNNPMVFGDFVESAMSLRTPKEAIQRIASMYQPPKQTEPIKHDYVYDATLSEAMQILSPLGKVIWRDGPLAGKDRSSTLAKLGHETVRSGLNPSQTKIVLMTADKRWGKYHLRHDGELEIDKLVVRVHS
ncbi:AE_Prim_S_like domain containing protein [uncultured Caudovirales phage]|uniref:AE_Prim_S_like domain containing protein n=1 Tax=uncultured Caudovirales phage TaxID=2100421 RepID=A0A6J7XBU6_9CAUD|nr:AE_Prim_S_like domain containing protein [uncultured Caudovirales phage]CAB5228536.1 AE_Prim_S_like domain containing protein [uncultured Caudovirales phage]